jgi:hypothetical protein
MGCLGILCHFLVGNLNNFKYHYHLNTPEVVNLTFTKAGDDYFILTPAISKPY